MSIYNSSCPVEQFGRECVRRGCRFQHKATNTDIEKEEDAREPCPYERFVGRCTMRSCTGYKHKDPNTLPICEEWKLGECDAWTCGRRHFYTDEDKTMDQVSLVLTVLVKCQTLGSVQSHGTTIPLPWLAQFIEQMYRVSQIKCFHVVENSSTL